MKIYEPDPTSRLLIKPASRAYRRRFLSLYATSRAIGQTKLDRLAWLIQFAKEDATTWRSADIHDRGDRLLALAGHAMSSNFRGGIALPEPLPESDVRNIHLTLKRFLSDIVNVPFGHRVALPSGDLQVTMLRATDVGQKPAIYAVSYEGDTRTRVLHQMKDLVLTVGSRLVACPLCGRPVLANHKRRFCDDDCAQRARDARKVERRQTKERGAKHGKTRKG